MKFSQELVDNIYNFKTISNIKKVDILLEMDAAQYTNCGKDSTIKDLEIVKKNSRYIYKTIKKINPTLGETFLKHQD
jgi:hypothetical protein